MQEGANSNAHKSPGPAPQQMLTQGGGEAPPDWTFLQTLNRPLSGRGGPPAARRWGPGTGVAGGGGVGGGPLAFESVHKTKEDKSEGECVVFKNQGKRGC